LNYELSDRKKENSKRVNIIHQEKGQPFPTVSKSFLLIDSSLMFSQNCIFAGWGHFEELQLKGNLSNISQIWPVEKKRVGQFDNSKNYFVESHCCAVTT